MIFVLFGLWIAQFGKYLISLPWSSYFENVDFTGLVRANLENLELLALGIVKIKKYFPGPAQAFDFLYGVTFLKL